MNQTTGAKPGMARSVTVSASILTPPAAPIESLIAEADIADAGVPPILAWFRTFALMSLAARDFKPNARITNDLRTFGLTLIEAPGVDYLIAAYLYDYVDATSTP